MKCFSVQTSEITCTSSFWLFTYENGRILSEDIGYSRCTLIRHSQLPIRQYTSFKHPYYIPYEPLILDLHPK